VDSFSPYNNLVINVVIDMLEVGGFQQLGTLVSSTNKITQLESSIDWLFFFSSTTNLQTVTFMVVRLGLRFLYEYKLVIKLLWW